MHDLLENTHMIFSCLLAALVLVHLVGALRRLSLLKTPNRGENLEIFASPPYRRGHDHDSFGPGFPALLPCS